MDKPERKMRKPTTRSGRLGGFTLVELAMVVVIIAIISAMAVPRFANSIAIHSVEGAARRIAADLNLARRRAMLTSATQTFRADSQGYSVVGMSHLDHSNEAYRIVLGQDCHGSSWVSYYVGGDQDLNFNMYGIPDSAATFVIRVGTHSRTITVAEQTGQVEIQE